MMKIKSKLPYIVGGVLGMLIVLTLLFAIKASSKGEELIALEKKADQLVEQNQELQSEIVAATSLTTVAKAAEELKMEKPEKFVYLTHEGVALR